MEAIFQQYPVVVLLSSHGSNQTPTRQLPSWLTAQGDADSIRPGDISPVSFRLPGFCGIQSCHDDAISPLRIPDSWQSTLELVLADWSQRSEGQRTVALCGAKNVGKSTLARILVNRFLSPDITTTASLSGEGVLFLDVDVGQPEFTPPGFISLTQVKEPILGPPHSHLMTPLEAFFVGDITWKTKPNVMAHTLEVLLAIYRSSWSHLPLVVNLDGWVKGLGEELLNTAVSLIQPTELLNLKGVDRCVDRW